MDLQQLLAKAFRLGDEGEWDEMATLLRGALDGFGEEPAVHCWLGVAERELGLEGAAYERFKRSLALEPDDPYVLATAGAAIAAFDDPEAEGALRTAALSAPGVALTRLMYGAYLSREGFLKDAFRELEAARELDAEDPQIHYELGVAHALNAQMDRAVDSVGEAVRLDPDDGWARVVLGLLLLEDDRPSEAATDLLSGARIRPEDVEAQLLAALAAAAVGDDGSASEMLERARQRGSGGDLVLATSVEDRLESGADASRRFLRDELAPGALRERLYERP